MARVFVAMSGGVDSSVAAALLAKHGHDVTGVTMQLRPSSDDEGGCCSSSAVRDARRVCDLLGIPHYVLNFRDVFEREVVTPFATQYAEGRTPNPCIACNDRVKFADLLAKVSAQGADALATGHYARIVRASDGTPQLVRGVDSRKDQSYFLYRLTHPQMERVMFPVGGMSKDEVREIAARLTLPTATRVESQDICFAPAGEHRSVVAARAPQALCPGEIVDENGVVLGEHAGIAGYTIGQRKGIGVGGTGDPLYVVRIDAAQNRVVVGPRDALRVTEIDVRDAVWHVGDQEEADVMVRYRSRPVRARVNASQGRLLVRLDTAVEGVAPGQSVVCYDGDTVIGGGYVWSAS